MILWCLISYLMALSSMLYELFWAYMLGTLLGQSLLRYQTAIALFVFGLGVGSLWAAHTPSHRLLKYFFGVECVLFLLGFFLFPASIILLGKSFFLIHDSSHFWTLALHVPLLGMAFLSGCELPYVLRIISKQDAFKGSSALVVAADCVGMVSGTVVFPLLLLGFWGLWGVLFSALATNVLGILATYILWRKKKDPHRVQVAVTPMGFY